ncbi:MAG: hypothetical protein K8S23_05015 [Candidatus Cloacimonetes bacterium]|nr:hypothetical protein [Candidatus Cloacimonadota bacterium]
MKNIMLIIFIIFSLNITATIINIPVDHLTIQGGVNAAVDGDTILIQQGIYYENIVISQKDIVIASLYLTTQDTSFISQTIVNGTQNGSVFQIGNYYESDEVYLIGFTITNGNGTFYDNCYCGGGIYSHHSNLHLSFMNICYNVLSTSESYPNGGYLGAGIYNNSGNLYINNSVITNNYIDLFAFNIHTTAYALGFGAGIYSCSSTNGHSLSLNNVTVSNNHIIGYEIDDVIILQTGEGGGIWCGNAHVSIVNSSVENNQISIINNYQQNASGGAIYSGNCFLQLINSNILNNSSSNFNGSNTGGIFLGTYGTSTINFTNSIIWNNLHPQINGTSSSSLSISYSDIEGGISTITEMGTINWLDGNIDADPLFVDPENGNYHLTALSPCIDTGDPNSPFDPDGTITDIGAFYFDQLGYLLPPDNVTISVNNDIVNISWFPVVGATSYSIFSSNDINEVCENWSLEVSNITNTFWNTSVNEVSKFYFVRAYAD